MDHPARRVGKRLCERVDSKFEPLMDPVFQLDMVSELLMIDAAIVAARIEIDIFVLADTKRQEQKAGPARVPHLKKFQGTHGCIALSHPTTFTLAEQTA